MNNDKKNALILVAVALGFIGYSYFLTTKIQDAETQISELKAIPPRPPEKKIEPGTIFKMPPMRYCEVGNYKRSVAFDGKDQFEYFNPGNDLVRGSFTIDKNTIVLATGKTSQQELIVKSWDNNNNVTEFSLDGREFLTGVCKTAEQERQEKQENERIEQERMTKEKAEIERVAAEKIEQERLAAEKAAHEKAEQERLVAEKAAQEKAEQERLVAEKAAQEKAEQERLIAEKAAQEKAEQERLVAEKAAQEKAEKKKTEKTKLEDDKDKDEQEDPAKKIEEVSAAPAKEESSLFLFD